MINPPTQWTVNFHSYWVHPLRVSNPSDWIHATAEFIEGIQALRQANLIGWFYATGGCKMGGEEVQVNTNMKELITKKYTLAANGEWQTILSDLEGVSAF